MSQFEKTKPISAKVSLSAFEREDYENKLRPGWRENKADLLRTEYSVMRIAKSYLKKQSQLCLSLLIIQEIATA